MGERRISSPIQIWVPRFEIILTHTFVTTKSSIEASIGYSIIIGWRNTGSFFCKIISNSHKKDKVRMCRVPRAFYWGSALFEFYSIGFIIYKIIDSIWIVSKKPFCLGAIFKEQLLFWRQSIECWLRNFGKSCPCIAHVSKRFYGLYTCCISSIIDDCKGPSSIFIGHITVDLKALFSIWINLVYSIFVFFGRIFL